ncbi:MAG: hypothetical protein WD226_12520 [Planctomycetota bacterium]
MKAIVLAVSLALALAPDVREEAREHLDAKRYEAAAGLLGEHLRHTAPDAATLELYAEALERLERNDEAAFQLEEALRAEADAAPKRIRELERRLTLCDPLGRRRAALVEDVVKSFGDLAAKLFREGHAERALDLAERVLPSALGKQRAQLSELRDEIARVFQEVELDVAGTGSAAELVLYESEFYRFEAELEAEVVELVGITMDDVFRYFVELFFDGDARRANERKVTIRIHADHETMASSYPGGGGQGVLGWWSPGEWRIVTFDTRSRGNSLNGMLVTLYHEAAHHFMTMFTRGSGVPAWLNEGTACFFEGAVAMADHRVLWPDAARPRLFSLASDLRQGTGPTLDQVVGFVGGGSYPGDHYPFGWGLVYFLQQYEDPTTLEYVWRPYYTRYRDSVLGKTERSRTLFEEVLLERGNPGGFEDFDAWIAAWSAWITDEVFPLHFGDERVARRRAKLSRYLAAADGQAAGVTVGTEPLLLRALEQIDFLRREEGEDAETPDLELALLEADVLERLDRKGSAAARLERILAWADEDRVALDEEARSGLEERMAKLDRRNASLRRLRLREKSFGKRAASLLRLYQREDDLPLRTYTFARRVGRLLGSQALLDAAPALRAAAVSAGRVPSRIVRLDGKLWSTVFPNEPNVVFSRNAGGAELGIPGRMAGRLLEDVELDAASYELRGTLTAIGEGYRSSFWGVVIAGAPDKDWFAVGVDGKRGLNLRHVALDASGAPTSKLLASSERDLAPAIGQPWELVVRVAADGTLDVRVGDVRWSTALPTALLGLDHAGLLVKDAHVRAEGLLVELFP